jgi:hypothetical protein
MRIIVIMLARLLNSGDFTMRVCVIFLFVVFCFSLDSAGSERVEIPLPGLCGEYADWSIESRVDTFRLDRIPTDIYDVYIRLSGTTSEGMYWCDAIWYPLWYKLEFGAIMDDPLTGGSWETAIGRRFELEIPFETTTGATWDFIKSDKCIVELQVGHALLVCGGLSMVIDEPASAFIDSVTIVIEADFQVGVRKSSWSKIKALYSE